MRILTIAALAAVLGPLGATLAHAEFTPEMKRLPKEPVWQAHMSDFSDQDYDAQVEKLIL